MLTELTVLVPKRKRKQQKTNKTMVSLKMTKDTTNFSFFFSFFHFESCFLLSLSFSSFSFFCFLLTPFFSPSIQIMSSEEEPTVIVVGASNIDLIAYVPRFPQPGETLKGHRFQQGFGGKGANQAVAAANLGAEVFMVTKVGQDVFGKATIENFEKKKVSTKFVFQSEKKETSTGCAPILVEDSGENSIVIVGGANDEMKQNEIDQISEVLSRCGLLLCQLEIPFKDTEYALRLARKSGVKTLLNTAPAVPNVNSLLEWTSILIANETEIYQVLGEEVLKDPTTEQTKEAASRLFKKGEKSNLECVIVTMGSKGCVVTLHNKKSDESESEEEQIFLPASKVEKVVDTTGAGDCFVGSFAYFLTKGKDYVQATRAAIVLAGMSVQKEGTQSSYPENLPDTFVW